MKKLTKLAILITAAAVCVAFTACAKLDAADIAGKINTDYYISLQNLGTDSGLKELGLETSIVYSVSGMNDFTEEYILKYNTKAERPNVYVKLNKSIGYGQFEGETIEYEYYDDRVLSYQTIDGVRTAGVVTYPSDVLGNNDHFENFKVAYIKKAMTAESFSTATLENLSAKKKSNKTVVTADVLQSELESVRSNYYKNVSGANYDTALYSGSIIMNTFTSVSYEYQIKNNRIDSKVIMIEGTGNISVGGSLVVKAVKIKHSVKYLYSISMPPFVFT